MRSSVQRLCRLAFVCAAAACASCSTASGDSRTAGIKIDGSSTVFVLTEAVAEEFSKAGHGARITVGQSGTGGGFQKFCRGETDIQNASRPIRTVETTECAANGIEFFEIPVAYDGIAVVVHPRATWVDQMTVAELKTLWAPEAQGRIKRWSQVRPGWPDREIHLFGAGVDSGTFDYFTEAVTGQARASRGDFTSSEDDNVLVQGVEGDELALGFLPFAYYRENQHRLRLVPIDDGNAANGTAAVAPSLETIRTGSYQPLSRPLFIYATSGAVARQPVQQFLDFYIAQVGPLADEVGYVQLGDEGYRLVAEHFARRQPGTLFDEDSDRTGLTIERLLAKERQ